MDRTILKDFTGKNKRSGSEMLCVEATNNDVLKLLQEMKGFFKEAANDLLQPRPEAVAQLLKKIQ